MPVGTPLRSRCRPPHGQKGTLTADARSVHANPHFCSSRLTCSSQLPRPQKCPVKGAYRYTYFRTWTASRCFCRGTVDFSTKYPAHRCEHDRFKSAEDIYVTAP
jgi:hypothetical protein